jgi:hypothetical protein
MSTVKMLKIITNLTNEDIARLKFERRMHWDWRGYNRMSYRGDEIHNSELANRGIEFNDKHYIEYEKRLPHDKYL